jgi:putative ABC transport system permease protein
MGRIGNAVKLGVSSLLLHKLRSGLTVLGIIFGVAAVISMLAVGEGSSRETQERIQELGATNIIVRSVKPSDEAQAGRGAGSLILNYGLKYEDYDRVLATVPTIKKALPIREIRKQIRNAHRLVDGRVVGTTHYYAEFNRLNMDAGRFLSAEDDDRSVNYAVLGWEMAATLFPAEGAVGKAIAIGTDYYTVVGVTAARAATSAVGGSLSGQNFDKDVYIPLSTCRLRFGERIVSFGGGKFTAEETQLTQLTLQVGAIPEVEPSHSVIAAAINPWHDAKKDVEIIVPYELLLEAQAAARRFSIILGTIASISLLVGGIGIMNIMLATVTERTREIGIRRALGAKRRDITQQFLIESIVLSAVGGLVGVSLGIAVPQVIVYFIPEQRAIVTVQSVVLAFGVSAAVGVLFGIYPAMRAARMDPIEALRHE